MLLLLSMLFAPPAWAEEPAPPLIQAVMTGDGEQVARLLGDGADPNGIWVANDGRSVGDAIGDFIGDSIGSPLSIAATVASGGLWPLFEGIARGLEDRRAVYTPVHLASQLAARGDADRVGILDAVLSAGGDPNLTTETHESALFVLLSRRGRDVLPALDVLLAHGADADAATPSGGVYARMAEPSRDAGVAISRADLVVLDRLLEAGARPETGGNLCAIVKREDLALFAWLLERGADVDTPCDGFGKTPMHAAAKLGDVDVARWLLAQGADPDPGTGASKGQSTPLGTALGAREPDLASVLLEAGADANGLTWAKPLFKDAPPLAHAVGRDVGERAVWIDLLLAHGADPATVDLDGHSALSYAAREGDRALVDRLLAVPAPHADRRTLALLMAHDHAAPESRPAIEAALPPDLPLSLPEVSRAVEVLGATSFVAYWQQVGAAGVADLATPHGLLWGDGGAELDLCGLDVTSGPRDARRRGAARDTWFSRPEWWRLEGWRFGFERPEDGGPRTLAVARLVNLDGAAGCDPRVVDLLGRTGDELRLLLGPNDTRGPGRREVRWEATVGGAPAQLSAPADGAAYYVEVTLR